MKFYPKEDVQFTVYLHIFQTLTRYNYYNHARRAYLEVRLSYIKCKTYKCIFKIDYGQFEYLVQTQNKYNRILLERKSRLKIQQKSI